jgi:hypothetical protein
VAGAAHGQSLPDPSFVIAEFGNGPTIVSADNTPDGGRDPIATFQVPVSGLYGLAVTDQTGGTGSFIPSVQDPQGLYAPGYFYGDFSGGQSFGVMGVQGSASDLSLIG